MEDSYTGSTMSIEPPGKRSSWYAAVPTNTSRRLGPHRSASFTSGPRPNSETTWSRVTLFAGPACSLHHAKRSLWCHLTTCSPRVSLTASAMYCWHSASIAIASSISAFSSKSLTLSARKASQTERSPSKSTRRGASRLSATRRGTKRPSPRSATSPSLEADVRSPCTEPSGTLSTAVRIRLASSGAPRSPSGSRSTHDTLSVGTSSRHVRARPHRPACEKRTRPDAAGACCVSCVQTHTGGILPPRPASWRSTERAVERTPSSAAAVALSLNAASTIACR
mmetsp:Transcript_20425/g.65734  ORF Transcript_20425/g.65734 Transcript_20425/m.65734 type:complete len:281 (+) Transcript_20425:921-1763(+)